MEQKTAQCVYCAHKAPMIFHAKVKWKNLSSSWYRCTMCNALMILPSPSLALLNAVYGKNYRNKRLQPHPGVNNRVRYSQKYRPTVFKEYLLSLHDLGLDDRFFSDILDYGCADGIFLEFCKQYFAKTTALYGVDISLQMVKIAQKNGFNAKLVKHLSQWKKRFDLITLWDVIEHIPQPYLVMRVLASSMRKGGRMVIQTPCYGILGELFLEKWVHLLPAQHVSIASQKSIQMLARRVGLKIDRQLSFSANAPESHVPQPYKSVFDTLAKKNNIGSVQLVSLRA